jgi:hypothetical protein
MDLRRRKITADDILVFAGRNRGNRELFEVLFKGLSEVRDRDDMMFPALVVCCEEGNVSGVEVLLAAGVSDLGRGIHVASGEGHVDVVRVLLEHGADVNHVDPAYPDKTLIIMAASSGSTETVRLLLDFGANVVSEVTGVSDAVVAASLGGHFSSSGATSGVGRQGHTRPVTHHRRSYRSRHTARRRDGLV